MSLPAIRDELFSALAGGRERAREALRREIEAGLPAAARKLGLKPPAPPRVAGGADRLGTLREQAAAITELRRAQETLARQVAKLQEQADRELGSLLRGLGRLRLEAEQAGTQVRTLVAEGRRVRRSAVRLEREVHSMAVSSQMQQVTSVVGSIQSAAYGQRGSVLAPNNLLLAANQLLWTFLEPVLRDLGLVRGSAPSLATFLAPLGSLATGYVAVGRKQHVRFVSGNLTIPAGRQLGFESLRAHVASAYWDELVRRTDVPVRAVTLAGGFSVPAAVFEGAVYCLRLGDLLAADPLAVAWVVDLGADIG